MELDKEKVVNKIIDSGYAGEGERQYLELITPRRLLKMIEVLNVRTGYISVVMDQVDDPHNQSAVLRSCDAMGIQNVSVIMGRGRFRPSKGISRGTEKWLTINRYDDSIEAIRNLKDLGYKIWSSHLGSDTVSIDDINLDNRVALVFGNEHAGVSEEVLNISDGFFRIPMSGFVESLNVSVATAISLAITTRRAQNYAFSNDGTENSGKSYYLNMDEKRAVFFEWLKKNTRLLRKTRLFHKQYEK